MDNNSEIKEKFQYYFMENMESFLSLSEEDKYVLIFSYNSKKEFHIQNKDYQSLKKSYDDGMKKENNLKDTIKEIIEDKEFFNLIKDILNSGKVKEYCCNPVQYIIKNNLIKVYNEFEEEKNLFEQITKKKKDISKFPINYSKDDIKEDDRYLSSHIFNECDNCDEYKCRFQKDYEYFKDNIFKEDFFKNRIIYSFLPYGIKACVNYIPKIVLNVCGNNIQSYYNENNPNEHKIILKALYSIIILHELIHLIRRENPKESFSIEYTPQHDNLNYEGGKSFIYHIFGDFVVIYMDFQFANVILKRESWEKNSDALKNEFLRFKDKKDKDIIDNRKVNEVIKCYDSIIEEKNNKIKEEDCYCCKFTI